MSLTTQEDVIPLVVDCNIWIEKVTQSHSNIRNRILKKNYQVILTSYMVVEILRVLKRLSRRISIPFNDLEALFWNFCNHSNILMKFEQPFADSLIAETKKLPEYQIIARLLDLEAKDVPYLVAAFQYNAILISDNLRSLISKRELIEKYLNVSMKSSTEFLEST